MALLVNLLNPGDAGPLRHSRLEVGGKRYKVRVTGDGVLVIRRNGQWEYYKAKGERFQYEKVGSTLKLQKD